jgi:hypothetical protein
LDWTVVSLQVWLEYSGAHGFFSLQTIVQTLRGQRSKYDADKTQITQIPESRFPFLSNEATTHVPKEKVPPPRILGPPGQSSGFDALPSLRLVEALSEILASKSGSALRSALASQNGRKPGRLNQ